MIKDLTIRRHFSCPKSGATIHEGKPVDGSESDSDGLVTAGNINNLLADADDASMHRWSS